MSFSGAKGSLIKPKPGCSVDWGHPLSRGLVGCWLINEGAGSTLNDIAGRNHGTPTGVGWAGSPQGGAFTGACVVGSGLNNVFNGADKKFSISIRAMQQDLSVNRNIITNYSRAWNFGTQSNLFRFLVITDDAGNSFDLKPTDVPVVQVWFHHVIIYDGSIDSSGQARVKWYINGKIQQTSVFTAPWEGPFDINGIDTVTTIGGTLAITQDARIYNRLLSELEVSSLYAAPYANILSPATRRWFLPAGGGIVEASFSSAGSASLNLVGASIAASLVTSAGAAITSLIGAAIGTSTITSAGAATATFVSGGISDAVFAIAGTGAMNAIGTGIASGTLSTSGTALFSATGNAVGTAVLNSVGQSTVTITGSSISDGAFVVTAGATVLWVSPSSSPGTPYHLDQAPSPTQSTFYVLVGTSNFSARKTQSQFAVSDAQG